MYRLAGWVCLGETRVFVCLLPVLMSCVRSHKLINTSILTYAMLMHFSDMQANKQIDIYNIYIYTVYNSFI